MRLHNIIVRLLILALYKLAAGCRQCVNPTMQACAKTRISNLIAATNRSKRVILVVFIVCVVILYTWPSWLPFGSPQIQIDPLQVCVDTYLPRFERKIAQYDAVVDGPPGPSFLPFVGNGFLGVAGSVGDPLLLGRGRGVDVPVAFHPVAEVAVDGYAQRDVKLIDFLSGEVHHMQCFALGKQYVMMQSRLFAHRTRPSVLVQEFSVRNLMTTPVTLDIRRTVTTDWNGSRSITKSYTSRRSEKHLYAVTVGTVTDDGTSVNVAVASVKLPDTITLNAGMITKYRVLTVVKRSQDKAAISTIGMEAAKELIAVLDTDAKSLRTQHQTAWKKLWRSGFEISRSRAAGALNGDRINATFYYLLSASRAPLSEEGGGGGGGGGGGAGGRRREAGEMLHRPDRCYSDHHTLQNARMWSAVQSSSELSTLVDTWLMTLEKKGCANLIAAGCEGVLQAALLSVGGLRFGAGHLEFVTHPRDLHRDYHFRRVTYATSLTTAVDVNVSVVVGADNRAVLRVAANESGGSGGGGMTLYACDGGCLDAPVKLGSQVVQLPVKLTDPVTAVLYVTSDLKHIQILKNVIHVHEIAEAPAHEHRVIALHKHGHHYGGLPVIFWVAIGLLVSVFHLFLFKLIFNEYCQSAATSYGRGRYGL